VGSPLRYRGEGLACRVGGRWLIGRRAVPGAPDGGCGTIAAPQPPEPRPPATQARPPLPRTPPESMAARFRGIPALWARRPLCSRA